MYTSTHVRVRVIVVSAAFLICVVGLLVRSAILAVGTDSRMRANLTVMNRSPESFVALGKQTEKLREMTASIDRFSLGDIKNTLADTARLVSEARTEFLAQYDAWIAVKGQTSKDREAFLEFKARLDETKNMQEAEIVRLKKALDEGSRPGWFETLGNQVALFVAGIASSWVASILFKRWERWSRSRDRKKASPTSIKSPAE